MQSFADTNTKKYNSALSSMMDISDSKNCSYHGLSPTVEQMLGQFSANMKILNATPCQVQL